MGENNSWGTPDYAARACEKLDKMRKEMLEIELAKAEIMQFHLTGDKNQARIKNITLRISLENLLKQ